MYTMSYPDDQMMMFPLIYCNGIRIDEALAKRLGVIKQDILAVLLYPQFKSDPQSAKFL